MEDVLRWSLLVIGGCIIVGVAVHGIWVSRKNSEQKSADRQPEQRFEQDYPSDDWQAPNMEDDPSLGNIDDIAINVADEKDDFNTDNIEPISSVEQFDDLGIGAVRVVSSSKKRDEVEQSESENQAHTEDNQPNTTTTIKKDTKVEVESTPESQPSGKIYASVVTQPKPEYAEKYQSLAQQTVAMSKEEQTTVSEPEKEPEFNISKVSNLDLNPARSAFNSQDGYDVPEPPPFLLKKEEGNGNDEQEDIKDPTSGKSDLSKLAENQTETAVDASVAGNNGIKETLTEQARNLVKRKKSSINRKRKEPKIAEDQMRIDFEDEPAAENVDNADTSNSADTTTESNQSLQEVLVLNVKVADDSPISGAALLPMLLTLGFKFGDQDIFHRHVNSNGKGPVLFSLANMFKPGNFDIDNLENFSTQGVSLFMILPIEGDPHQVFNMMHNAARKIADEFSAQVYDGRRTLLTKQSLQQYVEKIREFERQRLLNR